MQTEDIALTVGSWTAVATNVIYALLQVKSNTGIRIFIGSSPPPTAEAGIVLSRLHEGVAFSDGLSPADTIYCRPLHDTTATVGLITN